MQQQQVGTMTVLLHVPAQTLGLYETAMLA
jgi:hypothetical protein